MAQRTVLLLEDEPVIAADMHVLLLGLHCHVLRAADLAEALACCTLCAPDVVLLNFHPSDGTSSVLLAQTLQAFFSAKVIFVTGYRPQDLKTSSGVALPFPVLYKPFTRQQFKAIVKEHIEIFS